MRMIENYHSNSTYKIYTLHTYEKKKIEKFLVDISINIFC